MRLIDSTAKIYHLLLLKELHELGDINDDEYENFCGFCGADMRKEKECL